MAICPYCNGAGGSHGSYQPCYTCGGRGTRGHDYVACSSCGGSGQGTQRNWDTCWNCHGSGQVADPKPKARPAPAKKAVSKKPAARKSGKPKGAAAAQEPWTGWNTTFFIIGYLISLGILNEQSGLEGWGLFLLPIIPGAIAGRYWKQILVLAVIGLGLYLFATNQNG